MYTKLNKYLLNFFSKEFNYKSDYIFPYQRFFLIEFKVKKKKFFFKDKHQLKIS